MEVRKCPKCGSKWASAHDEGDWICGNEYCRAIIPKSICKSDENIIIREEVSNNNKTLQKKAQFMLNRNFY